VPSCVSVLWFKSFAPLRLRGLKLYQKQTVFVRFGTYSLCHNQATAYLYAIT
jgi:hypothetical protein